MIKQVILSQTGIRFDSEALRGADIDVSTVVLPVPTQPNVESEVGFGPALPPLLASPSLPKDDGGEYTVRKGNVKGVEEQTWRREQDVRTDIHDDLKTQALWWLLEILPTTFQWQKADGTWKSKWGYALMKFNHPV